MAFIFVSLLLRVPIKS